ncbi:hypothetical protein N7509_013069 [Penicillium cosmopolitanum]|uniref:Major facilitator superfamily (MFS) profile domain-containing protein n=1 Tax=Penicillium cosmopolitanum TaxID=1131564 RepID=A0A9W9SHB2_9EURO|nr:uncharacterized protein N7509_013069 [Penicillium cosmopolitanum]KAJ5376183.1 hypothetical protein N7509_013069 [Penicillium cosmopolitanum]
MALEDKKGSDLDAHEHDIFAMVETQDSPTSPPAFIIDGGLHGCLQVLGAFLILFNVWGINFAFGTFESFYALTYIPSFTASSISWIGTIQSWLLIACGIFSGPLFDRGHYAVMLLSGSVLAVFGFMMLSLSHKYYEIFLSQGVCMGLGFGLLYTPSIALVSRSFTRRRALALGVATSGAPAGGIVYNVMFNQLILKTSFAWTVRIMGLVMLVLFTVAAVLLFSQRKAMENIDESRPRKLIDLRAFKDLPFWSFTLANLLIYLGYITPYYYIPTYAQTTLHTSQSLASYVLVISQASSIIGRVGTTCLAYYYGSMVSWILCALLSGILCLSWISANTLARFILYSAFYGGISGALVPLPPSVFSHVCPDSKSLGTWFGMAQSISSIASLTGPPIAGALASIGSRSSKNLNFLGIQLFGGITMILGAFELMLLWYLLRKTRDKKGIF